MQDFYKNLKSIKSLEEITNEALYEKLPLSWYVFLCDIKDSTFLIKQGKYKEINMIAALSIIGVLNINKQLDLPFVFGGDGSYVFVPSLIFEQTKEVFLQTKIKAKEAYDIELRVGYISIEELYKQNQKLLITKMQISQEYFQAIINGGALEYLDRLLKEDKLSIPFKNSFKYIADFSGLECRWENIPSPKHRVLTLLIKSFKDDQNTYKRVLKSIDYLVGSKEQRAPIIKENIVLSFNPKVLKKEASLFSKNYIQQLLQIFKYIFFNFLGKYLMQNGNKQWKEYKTRVINSVDTEKFDDILRMVISLNNKEYKALLDYLEQEYQNKKIVYGTFSSNSSLMTCLIFERHGKHIHFVDGDMGGYAMASKEFKQRQAKSLSWK